METLRGYQFEIHQSVHHNKKFVFNQVRFETVDAHGEEEAQGFLTLEPEGEKILSDNFFVSWDKEYIYRVTCLGEVVYKVVKSYRKESEPC